MPCFEFLLEIDTSESPEEETSQQSAMAWRAKLPVLGQVHTRSMIIDNEPLDFPLVSGSSSNNHSDPVQEVAPVEKDNLTDQQAREFLGEVIVGTLSRSHTRTFDCSSSSAP